MKQNAQTNIEMLFIIGAAILVAGCIYFLASSAAQMKASNYPPEFFENQPKTQSIIFRGIDKNTNRNYCEKNLYVYGENEEGITTYGYVFEPEVTCRKEYDTMEKRLYDKCDTEELEIEITTYPGGETTHPDYVYVMEDNNGETELREIWSYENRPYPEYLIVFINFECDEAK